MVRYKNRYLTMELVWSATGSGVRNGSGRSRIPHDTAAGCSREYAELLTAVRESLQLNFGDLGLGQSIGSLQVKYLSPMTSTCVVRCSREHSEQVWAAITLITELNRRAVLLRMVDFSGNVQTCRQKLWKHEGRRLECLRSQSKLDASHFDKLVEDMKERIAAIET